MTQEHNNPKPLERGINIIRQKVPQLPASPGVYRMLGAEGKVLYVGKAKNLPKRVSSYANAGKLPIRLKRMVAEIQTIEILQTKTEAEALLLEANLIKTLKPIYNILLRDDKTFPYILLEEDHDFPRVTKYRGKKKKGKKYKKVKKHAKKKARKGKRRGHKAKKKAKIKKEKMKSKVDEESSGTEMSEEYGE